MNIHDNVMTSFPFLDEINDDKKVTNNKDVTESTEIKSKSPTCSTSDEKKNPNNKNTFCRLCEVTYKNLNEHKKLEKHKQCISKIYREKAKKKEAKVKLKKAIKKYKSQNGQFSSTSVSTENHEVQDQIFLTKFTKEKYFIRNWLDLSRQTEAYQNTLATFLALRYSLSNDYKNVKISMNNITWDKFGDIVIEVTNPDVNEIHAIQCKQTNNRNKISISAISSEKGRFSIKEQSEILSRLSNHMNYAKTYFKLYTVSNLLEDNNLKFIYDNSIVKEWKSKHNKELWKDRETIITLSKKKCLINSTDDPENICIFKIFKHEDKNLDKDLSKFRLYMNQKKMTGLKRLIKMIIEDTFDNTKDISNDLVKYISGYFKLSKSFKYNYKLTKRDTLLKIAELILSPYVLFPECTTEKKSVKLWNDTAHKFDIIVMRNNYDTVNKIYSYLNYVLKSETGAVVDTSLKSLKIVKHDVKNEALKSEIFHGFEGDSPNVPLTFLYTTLWKIELAPLVLRIENEDDLSLIIKIISFLKSEDILVKFILTTSLKINPDDFPNHLNSFLNLEDLRRCDNMFLERILNEVRIPVLDFSLCLREIVDCNKDFLGKDTIVSVTDASIEDTIVFTDENLEKVKDFFQRRDDTTKTNNLSYLINVKGNPTLIEIPPNI